MTETIITQTSIQPSSITTIDALKKSAIIHKKIVEWSDMDAFGHVNNVAYHRYAESARIGYLTELNIFSDTVLVVAKASCTYIKPVVFPDTLNIGVYCNKVGTTSMVLEYVLFSEKQQAVVATLETILVQLDKFGKISQPWTEDQRKRVLELQMVA